MADYKEMYKKMFVSVSQAIELLQKAQQEAEELYLKTAAEEPVVLADLRRNENAKNG
ncbi:MAG: hypothetical protein LBS36_08320 [Oscillospiraceae bacterium]|jgi:hypothetical protein|nr:hypothetical protein [Oscillospiraceae bacterium]